MSIAVETRNGVAHIGIARPEKKNAITVAMYQAMADAIAAAHDDGRVRAILIYGDKDIFTAGNDLEDFMKNPPTGMDAPVFRFMQALGLCGKAGRGRGQRGGGRHRHDDADALRPRLLRR